MYSNKELKTNIDQLPPHKAIVKHWGEYVDTIILDTIPMYDRKGNLVTPIYQDTANLQLKYPLTDDNKASIL